jgi:PAS domain S-box-containing protein
MSPHRLAASLRGFIPALAALTVAAVLHLAIASTIGIGSAGIFFLYLMAILIAAWCGYGPGLLVLVLAVAVAPYVYRRDFSLRRADPVGVLVLLSVTLITSQLSANRRRTEALLRQLNQQLEARVKEQTRDLERANTAVRLQFLELEMLYRKIPVGICFLDPELRIIRLNEKLAEFTALPLSKQLGRYLHEVLQPETYRAVEPLYRRVLETGQSVSNYEITTMAPGDRDGSARTLSLECSRVEADDGSVLGVQVIVLDVTERNQSQRALARANEELTHFAYVAAHDLQEPLRTLVAYSQLIQRKSEDALSPQTHAWLGTLAGAAIRMSRLIQDLLTYSRTTADAGIGNDTIDLEEVFAGAIEELKAAIDETGAEISHDPLPVVQGDAVRLGQVFHNLLSNSLKFQRSGVSPVIRVAVNRSEKEWILSVEDNGQGFRNEYAERVFGMFKRLHGQDVPGTGLGLAICKAVVERHGGSIRASSEVGKGATFTFTLPAHHEWKADRANFHQTR